MHVACCMFMLVLGGTRPSNKLEAQIICTLLLHNRWRRSKVHVAVRNKGTRCKRDAVSTLHGANRISTASTPAGRRKVRLKTDSWLAVG